MKKLSSRDKAIIIIIAFLGILLGWAACHIWESRKPPITVENPANEGLKKRGDSLEAVIHFNDSLERLEDKKQVVFDSILINNNKTLKKYYEEFNGLDMDARISKYDSILANYYKVRR